MRAHTISSAWGYRQASRQQCSAVSPARALGSKQRNLHSTRASGLASLGWRPMQSSGTKSTAMVMELLLASDSWSTTAAQLGPAATFIRHVWRGGAMPPMLKDMGGAVRTLRFANYGCSATVHNTLHAWPGVPGKRCAHQLCVLMHGSGDNMHCGAFGFEGAR